MSIAAIAFGGNQGDVPHTWERALEMLHALPDSRLQRMSRLYQTRPMGAAAGSPFLNGVVLLETGLDPLDLLNSLQRIENDLGRVRQQRWGPRSADLDLLALDHKIVDTDRLQLPHPGLWYRRFVLDPWQDVDPHWDHPLLGETVLDMKQRLDARPLLICLQQMAPEIQTEVDQALQASGLAADVQFFTAADRPWDLRVVPPGTEWRPRSIYLNPDQPPANQILQWLSAALDHPQVLPPERREPNGD